MSIIKLSCSAFTLELDENGIPVGFYSSDNAQNILNNTAAPFAYIVNAYDPEGISEERIPLVAISRSGNTLLETFADGTTATVSVREDNVFIRFTLESVSRKDFFKIAFVSVELSAEHDFCGSCVAATLNCKPAEYPGMNSLLALEAYPAVSLGAVGASGSLTAGTKSDLREKLKIVVSDFEQEVNAQPVNPLGGPFALDHPDSGVSRAYTILPQPLNVAEAEKFADKMQEFGLSQVNLHPGYGMYAHGSFEPNPDVYGDMDGFQKLVDVFHKRGIQVFLHTYTFFIGHNSSYVTPVPHPDLGTIAEFTLAQDLNDCENGEIRVLESVENVDPHAGYKIPGSAILWIDDELIHFDDTDRKNSFIQCERGFNKTHTACHKAGAKVKIVLGYFTQLAPRAESPLFYEIARKTADFYNTIHADGFYFDAIDGVFILGGNEYAWYHSMLFLKEMFKNLDHAPVFDCCYGPQYPSTWLLRSRMGTLDNPTRGYRDFIDVHVDYCQKNASTRFLIPSLGWKNLYPGEADIVGDMDADTTKERGLMGWQNKLWGTEDVEYLCLKGLALNACMSYHNTWQYTDKHPILKRYAKIMAAYDRVRSQYSFSDDFKAQLAAPNAEFHMEESSDKPVFLRQKTVRIHLGEKTDTVQNPFAAQKPIIRLEALRTAGAYDTPDAVTLCEGAEFDGGETRKIVRSFAQRKNTNGLTALGLLVEGDGSGATLCVRVRNDFAMKSASAEHFIRLDFTGTRYFPCWENENCEQTHDNWPRTELEYRIFTDVERFYDIYSNGVKYDCLDCVEFEVNRPCKAKIHPVKIMKDRPQSFVNPSLTVGTETLCFHTTLQSGTLLEYDPETGKAAVYDLCGKLLEEPAAQGSLTFSTGENTVLWNHAGRAAAAFIFRGEAL